MSPRTRVVLGMLGRKLDAGFAAKRWNKWRPTVALCQHSDLPIDRFELLHHVQDAKLCARVAEDIRSVSETTTVNTHAVEWSDAWDLEEVYSVLLDFARRYTFRPAREDYLVHITTGTHIVQISSYLLTESRYLPAKLVQTSPVRGTKNVEGSFRIIDLDLSKYDRIAQRFRQEQREGLEFLKAGIDTRNQRFNQLVEQIERVSIASRDPLLLTGPTGAGKSQLARRIFELKQARTALNGALVDVNCATIRGDGAMSALFGHLKGAFTGAAQNRKGYIKNADAGVLFLDEIGELGSDEQAMLLQALERGTFYPVGADKTSSSDFQLIAGTNRDLRQEVARGRFRADLLARINLWSYALPGLRDRPEDIEPNLEFELQQCRRSLNLNVTMSSEARALFLDFALSIDALWLGNFRDLAGAVRRMATLAPGGRIGTNEVSDELERLRYAWNGKGEEGVSRARRLLGERISDLDQFDISQLETVLEVCERATTMAEAGKQLFAVSRLKRKSTNDSDRIRKYLARFGLRWSEVRSRV